MNIFVAWSKCWPVGKKKDLRDWNFNQHRLLNSSIALYSASSFYKRRRSTGGVGNARGGDVACQFGCYCSQFITASLVNFYGCAKFYGWVSYDCLTTILSARGNNSDFILLAVFVEKEFLPDLPDFISYLASTHTNQLPGLRSGCHAVGVQMSLSSSMLAEKVLGVAWRQDTRCI